MMLNIINLDSNGSPIVKSETANANHSQAVVKTQSPKITIPSSSDQTKIVMTVVQTTTADIKTEPKPIRGNVQKKFIYLILFASQINSIAWIHLNIW